MSIGTRLLTKLKGELVGEDAFGNKYYQERTRNGLGVLYRRKRWVMYKGKVEGSKVPAEWHAWLHYTNDTPLEKPADQAWRKDHLPNLTGTLNAYVPKGDERAGGERAPSSADYQAWRP